MLQVAIGEMLPDKRFTRLEDGLKRLEMRIGVELDGIDLTDDQTFDVLEEGIHQLARAFSDTRRQYVAELVASGLIADKPEQQEVRHFLRILNQLGDEDIAVLVFHQNSTDTVFYEGMVLARERLLASYGLLVITRSDLGGIGISREDGAKDAFGITEIGRCFLGFLGY